MLHLKNTMNKELQKAFKLVLKELKEGATCKKEEYSFGCYSCAVQRIYEDLKDYYEMNK